MLKEKKWNGVFNLATSDMIKNKQGFSLKKVSLTEVINK